MVQIASDRYINYTPPKSSPNPSTQKQNENNGQVEMSQDPTSNVYWVPVMNHEAFDQIHADALHCRQVQNKKWGNTLEQIVDEVIRGWEQTKRTCKPHNFDHH